MGSDTVAMPVFFLIHAAPASRQIRSPVLNDEVAVKLKRVERARPSRGSEAGRDLRDVRFMACPGIAPAQPPRCHPNNLQRAWDCFLAIEVKE